MPMSLYRLPALRDTGDALLFDYAAEVERKERAARRVRAACATVLAFLLAACAREAGSIAAIIRPWLPLLLVTALTSGLLAIAYRQLERRG